MKHLLKKSEMARLLAVAITAFACVCMWGCSSVWDESEEDVFGRLNGYVKETGVLWWADESRSTATGMVKTLPYWINDKILDGEQKDRFGIYLNRPKMYAFILILNFEIL